ncbi:MAG: hypothetical protein K2G09_05935, partial [Paramuribaculum sp.]|nr:hypothetical protein [Paramuribaculum sp.]
MRKFLPLVLTLMLIAPALAHAETREVTFYSNQRLTDDEMQFKYALGTFDKYQNYVTTWMEGAFGAITVGGQRAPGPVYQPALRFSQGNTPNLYGIQYHGLPKDVLTLHTVATPTEKDTSAVKGCFVRLRIAASDTAYHRPEKRGIHVASSGFLSENGLVLTAKEGTFKSVKIKAQRAKPLHDYYMSEADTIDKPMSQYYAKYIDKDGAEQYPTIKGNGYFTFENLDGEVTFGFSYDVLIYEIVVEYEDPSTLPPPSPVFAVHQYAEHDYGIRYTPPTETDNAKLLLTTLPTAAKNVFTFTEKDPKAEIYYTTNPDIPAPTQFVTLTSLNKTAEHNESTEWMKATPGKGIYLGSKNPFKVTKIRAVAFRKYGGSSAETVIETSMYRVQPPELDLERTLSKNSETAGTITYDEEKGYIYYTGYNPSIYLKSEMRTTDCFIETEKQGGTEGASPLDRQNKFYIFYTTDFTKPTTSSKSLKWEKSCIEVPTGTASDLPANGTMNVIHVMSMFLTESGPSEGGVWPVYDTNEGDYKVFRVVRKTDEINTKTMAKPIIKIDGDIPTVSLPGNITGYLTPELPIKITAGEIEGQDAHGKLQYQLFDTWNQSPEGTWASIPYKGLKVSGQGRVFAREFHYADYAAPFSYFDFRHIDHTQLEDIQPETLADIPEGNLVKISGKLWVRGAYNSTNAAAPGKDYQQLLFITDENGNALRVTGDYAFGDKDLSGFFDAEGKMITDIVGELRGQTKGMPELHLTTT